jgi:hypothetical protein
MTAFTENIAAGCIIWFREIICGGNRSKFWIDPVIYNAGRMTETDKYSIIYSENFGILECDAIPLTSIRRW